MWPGHLRKQAKVCHFVKMEWVDYMVMIRFLSLKAESTTNFHKRLPNVYGKSAPCYALVTSRLREFRRGREDVKVEHHSGRQIMQNVEENVTKFHLMMLENLKLGIESIVKETGLSMDTTHTVVRDHLSMSKLCARWVPRMISTALLTNYTTDPEIFHLRMVIGDDAWVHYHKPESKFESMKSKHAGYPRRKCSRAHPTHRNLR